MSKETILEEFEKLTPCPEDCGNGYNEQKEWLERNNHLYHNEVYNEPMYDLSEEKVKEFIEKAIDQTEEETIRKVEEMLPEEKKLKEYEKTDPNVLTEANIRNLKISFENQAIAPYVSAYNELRQEVLNILNKLKK